MFKKISTCVVLVVALVCGSSVWAMVPKAEFNPELESLYQSCLRGRYDNCNKGGYLAMEYGEHTRAHAMFKITCRAGWKAACHNAAISAKRFGDMVEARRLWREACRHGVWASCDSMAKELVRQKQWQQALGFAKRACRNKLSACVLLGQIYKFQGMPDLALEMFGRACNGQVAGACYRAGFVAKQLGVLEALDWFNKSCDMGAVVGCSQAAMLYQKQGNVGQAALMFKDLCRNYDSYVDCVYWGDLERGRGRTSVALAAFKRACRGGYQPGCARFN